jgi:drug/metabolite transporter (DMT)-like permease
VSAREVSSRHAQSLALLAAALVGVQVGAATVASRFALPETDPVSLAFMRYLIGALSLLPFILAAPRPKFQARDLPAMAALGIVQFAILVLLLNVGLTYITAGRAALVFSAFPLLTMLLGAALGREAMTPRKTTGLVLTLLGVGLALGDKVFGGAAQGLWGEVLVFGAALCGAICSVFYRPYLVRYPALPVAGFAMAASVVFLAVIGAARGGLTNPLTMSGRAQAAVVFIGLSSGLAYFVLLWAYARLQPTRVTMFQPLAPLTATALGVIVLGESLTWNFLAGLAAVGIGILIAVSTAPRRT